MTADEAFAEISTRRISLVPALGLWAASVDIKGAADHNRKRAIRSESAFAQTPIQAVNNLVAKLDARAEQLQLIEITL